MGAQLRLKYFLGFTILTIYISSYPLWNKGNFVSFTFQNHKITAKSSDNTVKTFLNALRIKNISIQSYVYSQLRTKRRTVIQAIMREWGIHNNEWNEVLNLINQVRAKDKQESGVGEIKAPSTLPKSIKHMMTNVLKQVHIPPLTVTIEDDDVTLVERGVGVNIAFNKKMSATTSVYNLNLHPNFFSYDQHVQRGILLHEIAGHIKRSHLVEERILQTLILTKVPQSFTVDQLNENVLWKKFKRMQEREADWFAASTNLAAAKNIEKATKRDYEMRGHCDGATTNHPSNKKRYESVQIIRRLLETQ